MGNSTCFDANHLYLFGQVPVLIGTSTCTYLNNYLYLLGQVPVLIWTTTCTYLDNYLYMS